MVDDDGGGVQKQLQQYRGRVRYNCRCSRYYANGNAGMSTNPPNARNMADDALAAAYSHINFRPYDNDGNDFVDAFIVVHAGHEAEQTGNRVRNIWSLKWVLLQVTVADGVKVYAFLTVSEDAKIGVCA